MRSKQSNGYDDAFMEACRAELTVTAESMEQTSYWVAESNGTLAGCAALGRDEGDASAEVHAFFIDPDWQGRGIGRLLWDTILGAARGRGLTRLQLAADPAAVPFYEKLGFATVGQIPSGSIAGRALPLMSREI